MWYFIFLVQIRITCMASAIRAVSSLVYLHWIDKLPLGEVPEFWCRSKM